MAQATPRTKSVNVVATHLSESFNAHVVLRVAAPRRVETIIGEAPDPPWPSDHTAGHDAGVILALLEKAFQKRDMPVLEGWPVERLAPVIS